jgi:CheY-like chemotaxis protein
MDGPTTLAYLRKNPRTSHIPVLFLTARTQTGEIEQYISLGAQGVLSKPFNAMTLAASVRDYLPPSAAHHAHESYITLEDEYSRRLVTWR